MASGNAPQHETCQNISSSEQSKQLKLLHSGGHSEKACTLPKKETIKSTVSVSLMCHQRVAFFFFFHLFQRCTLSSFTVAFATSLVRKMVQQMQPDDGGSFSRCCCTNARNR